MVVKRWAPGYGFSVLENTKFQFVTTEDGSLSARIGAPGTPKEECSEAMHSLRGAFSETVYIYGTALREAALLGASPRALSMGLGLGYVELLAAGVALALDRQVAGESFEIVPELREYFLGWLSGGDCPSDFAAAYDSILDRTAHEVSAGLPGARLAGALASGVQPIRDVPAARASEAQPAYDDRAASTTEAQPAWRADLNPSAIKAALAHAVASGAWKVREALDAATVFDSKFGAICFDAFSSKTTPDLWSEEFLTAFFKKTAARTCVLSTYACTGALKRSLRNEGFTLTIREGFSSKRDSTFAVRQPV